MKANSRGHLRYYFAWKNKNDGIYCTEHVFGMQEQFFKC